MKKLFFTSLFAILFSSSFASHWIGGNIEFECVNSSTNQYILRTVWYNDCGGINYPTSISMTATSSCGNVTVTLNPVVCDSSTMSTVCEINNICTAFQHCTECSGNTSGCPKIYPGLEKVIYEGTTTLTPCANWKATYSSCCRNSFAGFATNMNNTAGSSWYIESTLNNLNATCNSSPQFTFDIPPFICEGFVSDFTFSAQDPDGDSLVFSLVDPLVSAGTGIGMDIPYTANCFMPNDPGCPSGVNFNPTNGHFSTVPATNPPVAWTNGYGSSPQASWWDGGDIQVYFSVMVEEYRNGQKIGSVVRDIQLNTLEGCAPLGDVYTQGIVNLNYGYQIDSSEIEVYLYDSVKFNILLFDTTNITPFNVSSDFASKFVNASFNQNTYLIPSPGGSYVVGEFSHYVVPADTGTHWFSVTAQNGGCPLQSDKTYTFKVKVYNQTNPARGGAGISDKLSKEVFVYPNPSSGLFTIEARNASVTTVEVYSLVGERIFVSAANIKQLDMSNFEKGVYLLKLTTDKGIVNQKIILE